MSDSPPPSGDPTDLTGRTLGEYRVLRQLGIGGMGAVYLAEQSSLHRKVALKILKENLAGNPVSLARFQAEARNAARLTHANIVQVHAIGEADGLHFMALEYVEGRNLRDFLNRKGPLDLALALAVMRQVAAALQRAGEAGFVHRDIKPENILITRKGEVKVADFGLSRTFEDGPALNLTQSGVTLGTPLYMSPEQVQGKPVDPRSDIYSFGVTAYHLLAGVPPYTGSSAFEVALQHVNGSPTPLAEVRPDLPPMLCELVARMMAKSPDQRPQNAREVLRELNRLRDSAGSTVPATIEVPPSMRLPSVAPEATVPEVSEPVPGRTARRWPWVAGLVLALAGAASAGVLVRYGQAMFTPVPNVVEVPEPSKPHPVDEEIAKLRKELDEDKTVRGPFDRQANANRARVMVLLLDRERYDDVEQYAKELDGKQAGPVLEMLARLGYGIVLAYRDGRDPKAPSESMDRFKEAFASRKLGPKLDKISPVSMVLAADSPLSPLLPHIRDAIDRNVANKVPLPAELDPLMRGRPSKKDLAKP